MIYRRMIRCETLERRHLLAADVCLASEPIERIAADDSFDALVEQQPQPQGVEPRSWADVRAITTLPVTDDLLPLPPEGWGDFERAIVSMTQSSFVSDAVAWDLVEEEAGRVAAVRQHHFGSPLAPEQPAATVYLFDREQTGDLVPSGEIDLDFTPQRILFSGESISIVGRQLDHGLLGGRFRDWVWYDAILEQGTRETVLLSIDGDDLTRQHRTTLDGMLSSVAVDGDRLFVSTFAPPERSPAVFPPSQLGFNVHLFTVTEGEQKRIASGRLPRPVEESMIFGDDILMIDQSRGTFLPRLDMPKIFDTSTSSETIASPAAASSAVPIGGSSHLFRYRIDGDGLERIAALEVPGFTAQQFEIADNGKTAVAVGSLVQSDPDDASKSIAGVSTAVQLFDLSGEEPRVFQIVKLAPAGWFRSIEIGARAVVIVDGEGTALVVDTDPTIDTDPESRVRRIEWDAQPGSRPGFPVTIRELSPETFLLSRPLHRGDSGDGGGLNSESERSLLIPVTDHPVKEIVVLSIDEMALIGRSVIEADSMIVFHPSSSVPQVIDFDHRIRGGSDPYRLVIGNIDASGEVESPGAIDASGALELDVDGDRLLIRKLDRLVQFRWDDLDTPTEMILGDRLPEPVATEDVFRINADSNDIYLDVLANDQFIQHHVAPGVEIVDLIDAPEGVLIGPSGRVLRLTDALLARDGTFNFTYVIRQGSNTSSATVTLTLYRYSDEQVRQAIDRVIAEVSRELGVDQSEISIAAQREYTRRPMPEKITSTLVNPLGGQYGVIVDVIAGDQLYRYAADFDDQVAQLSRRSFGDVMALHLEAVDAEGNPLSIIRVGDEFFLQVTAEDLRPFGSGVFGVAFDLPLPSRKLQLTGQVELLGKFDDFGSPVTAEGIDEFKAVEVLIEPPGIAPQPVVRFGVRAVAGGEVGLQLNPGDTIGAELLIRGRDDLVSPLEVRFGSLTFEIDGLERTDTDANGEVTPSDALRVINFLGLHGSVSLEGRFDLAANTAAEFGEINTATMHRLDTNGDGQITARDALLVINDLARHFVAPAAEAEQVAGGIDLLSDDDDADALRVPRKVGDTEQAMFRDN